MPFNAYFPMCMKLIYTKEVSSKEKTIWVLSWGEFSQVAKGFHVVCWTDSLRSALPKSVLYF